MVIDQGAARYQGLYTELEETEGDGDAQEHGMVPDLSF